MISNSEVEKIQSLLIDKFGGKKGIRDKKALDAALQRPYSTFDKKDLYPSPILKAAAVFQSIISNHPFVDGNKRIGYVLMRLTLQEYKVDIKTSEQEKYEFVIHVASGKLSFEQICEWIEEKLIELK